MIAMADPALGLARTGDRDAGLEFPTSSVLWVFDLSTGARTQVASGPDLATPAWSPDGSQIAYYFNSYRGYRGLYRKASNGTGREQLLYRFTTLGAYMCIADWSTDGRFVVFQSGGVLHALPLTGDRHVVELMREEESRVRRARLSPDSRFLAYTLLEEPDRSEIYVRAFDPVSGRLSSGGGPWQVSNQGGLGAVQWKSDGKELFYLAADGGVMAVDVAPTPVFTAGPPRLLLRAPGLVAQVDVCNYGADLSRDAQQVVSTVPMPTERKAITIAPAILARYTGRYVGRPDADPGDAVLTLEGNQLMYQCCFSGEPPTGARKFPLFAESDTYFFRRVPGGDFDHEFFKDDNGVVTHYLLHQGGSSGLKRTRR